MKTAAFDVDCQKTFTPICPNELPVRGGDSIVSELNRQASWMDFRLGSKDAHHPKAIWQANEQHPPLNPLKGKNVDCYWPAHAIVGTQGFELLDGLPQPMDYDYFIWKGIELDLHPYGACYHDLSGQRSTGVIEFLAYHSVSTVFLGGLALDFCVKETALQLLKAEFKVVINLAATRGLAEDSVLDAKNEISQAGGRFIENSQAAKVILENETL